MMSRRAFFRATAWGAAILGLPFVLRHMPAEAKASFIPTVKPPKYITAQTIADRAARMLYEAGHRFEPGWSDENKLVGVDSSFSTADRTMPLEDYIEGVLIPKVHCLSSHIGARPLRDVGQLIAVNTMEFAIGQYEDVTVRSYVHYNAEWDRAIDTLEVLTA